MTTTAPRKTFEAFPIQTKLWETIADGRYRYIGFGGAIRGTKTWGTLLSLIVLCKLFPKSRWAVVRKDLPTLRRNVVPSLNKLRGELGDFLGELNQSDWTYTATNGSQIILFPESLDTDPDWQRWKGLEVNGFLLEEADELAEGSFHKAQERAGSWIITGATHQPPPTILCTFNPCANWPKHVFFDPWEQGTIAAPYAYLPATAADNPSIPEVVREAWKNMPEQEYRRFVLADWTVLSGRYYDNVDRRVHLIPRSRLPKQLPHWWTYWGAYDWGYAHWSVFGAFAMDGDGTAHLLDTVWQRRGQDGDYAKTIRATVPEQCLETVYAGHDCWNVAVAKGASGVTTYEVFAEHEIYLRKADTDKINGGRAVRRALDFKRDATTEAITQAPRLYIVDTPGNRRVLEQLATIMPDENNVNKPAKIDADSEGRGGDDGADMLRYGVASHPPLASMPVPKSDVADLQEVAWANARGESLEDGGYTGGVTVDYDPVDYG